MISEPEPGSSPIGPGPLWPEWQPLWLPVRSQLETLLEPVRAAVPELTVRPGAFANPYYPLSTFVSLNVTGPPWDDDVVLSAAVRHAGNELVFDCDISTGEGQILAEQERQTVSTELGEAEVLMWAQQQLDGYVAFVSDELDLIGRALTAARRAHPLPDGTN